MRKLLRRLVYWLGQRHRDADLREELAFHRARAAAEFEREGYTENEAARAAGVSLGNAVTAREDARAVWIWPWCQSVAQDLGYALRSLRRQPSFALVPLVALATAIGIAVSLFTVFNAVILRPWPVADPDHFVGVYAQEFEGARGFSIPEYRYLADHATTVSGLVATLQTTAYLGDEAVDDAIRGSAVSNNFFDVLRVPMMAGRPFTAADGAGEIPAAVAILNYRLWRSRFGGSASVVGSQLRLNGVPFTVVGIAAESYSGLQPGTENFWIPLAAAPLIDHEAGRPLADPGWCCSDLSGRLSGPATRGEARAELEILSRQFRSQFGMTPAPILVTGTTFLERPNPKGKALPLLGLIGLGAFLMLMIACANVGNLLLARGATRAREMAVRLSLGASRARLVRQLLTESLVLALAAGAIGTALAYGLPSAMLTLAGEPPPYSIVPDGLVLVFAVGLTLVVCIGSGLAPAIHGTRANSSALIRESSGAGAPHLGIRRALLATQVAVSVSLLTGAALSARSVENAQMVNADFAVQDITAVSFQRPSDQSRGFGPEFYARLLDDLRGLHVPVFGLAETTPLDGVRHAVNVRLSSEAPDHRRLVGSEDVSAGYFQILRIPVVAGRTFAPTDVEHPVALINQSLAREMWPDRNPIGQTVYAGDQPAEVVGVVKDVHTSRLDQIGPMIYRPFTRGPRATLFLPANGQAAEAVARAVHQLRPDVHPHIERLQSVLDRALAPSRAGALLAAFLGVFALGLATVGMWGVFGYVVAQRTREIGIRMSLGATSGQVIRLILAGNSRALLIGFGVGLLGAGAVGRLLQSYLYGVSAWDATAFGSVIAILAVAATAASYGPARRASRINPSVALRTT
jgi:predicted permease